MTSEMLETGAGEVDAEAEDRAAAVRRIESWWPAKIARADPEPPTVAFTRVAVRAAGPPDGSGASAALSSCHNYALWRKEQKRPLDPAIAFGADELDRYAEEALAGAPVGSRTSALWQLARLAPGVGYGSKEQRRRAPNWRRVALAPDVAEVIATYAPEKISPDRFSRVESIVREVVASYFPASAERARHLVCWCTYLAVWVDSGHGALRVDSVYSPATVESFVAHLLASAAINERSVGTMASALRAVAAAVLPDLPRVVPVVVGKPAPTEPYSEEELDSLLYSAARMRSAAMCRHTRALIILGLATGPLGAEASCVRPSDVKRTETGRLTVQLRRADGQDRAVVATERYAEMLEEVVASAVAGGDAYLLGVNGRESRASDLVLRTSRWPVSANLFRLTATHRVQLALEGRSLLELLEAAGVSTLEAFNPLLPFIWERHAAGAGGHEVEELTDADFNRLVVADTGGLEAVS